MAVSAFPWLFAAVHVLHRLSMPRHPPRALSSFSLFPKARIDDSRLGFVARRAKDAFLNTTFQSIICGLNSQFVFFFQRTSGSHLGRALARTTAVTAQNR